MKQFKYAVAGITLALTACAGNAPVRFVGSIMADNAGMTLYTYDKDAAGSGKSACNGPCAANWPPLKAAADDRPGGYWSIITRDDGSKQWAYQGKPLYLWSKDRKPGDKTGDGFNNEWHVVAEEAERPESSGGGGGGY